jgi:hypothetical protein
MGRSHRVKLRGRPIETYVVEFGKSVCEFEYRHGKWQGYICGDPADGYIPRVLKPGCGRFPIYRCERHAARKFGSPAVNRRKEFRNGISKYRVIEGTLVALTDQS